MKGGKTCLKTYKPVDACCSGRRKTGGKCIGKERKERWNKGRKGIRA